MTIDLDEGREAVGDSKRLLETGARSFGRRLEIGRPRSRYGTRSFSLTAVERPNAVSRLFI